jgi:hypothetical protein
MHWLLQHRPGIGCSSNQLLVEYRQSNCKIQVANILKEFYLLLLRPGKFTKIKYSLSLALANFQLFGRILA